MLTTRTAECTKHKAQNNCSGLSATAATPYNELESHSGNNTKLAAGVAYSAYQTLFMEHFSPWDLSEAPELKAVCNRPSVKPVVEGAVITPHVVISVRVEQLIDGKVASNAEGLPAYQESHDCQQGHLCNSRML